MAGLMDSLKGWAKKNAQDGMKKIADEEKAKAAEKAKQDAANGKAGGPEPIAGALSPFTAFLNMNKKKPK
jgi:hypothetical protein